MMEPNPSSMSSRKIAKKSLKVVVGQQVYITDHMKQEEKKIDTLSDMFKPGFSIGMTLLPLPTPPPPQDISQCLEILLVCLCGGGSGAAAKPPTVPRQPLTTKKHLAQNDNRIAVEKP